MKGSPKENLDYCSKQDANFFQFGELPQQGKRSDLISACEVIRSGQPLRSMIEEHGPTLVKYARGLTTYRSLCATPRDPSVPPRIFWLYGPTGTGKTKCAWELALQLAGGIDGIWISSGSLRWFDGYDGQSVVILDDFRPKHVEFAFLLRLTDRYPLNVEFKGGHVPWRPSFIFFTSPDGITSSFATRLEFRPEDIGQLERRIERSVHFPDGEADFRASFHGHGPGLQEGGHDVTTSGVPPP